MSTMHDDIARQDNSIGRAHTGSTRALCKTRLPAVALGLIAATWSAGSAQAALIGHFAHNYVSVDITLDLFDGQPGGKYLWQYTVDNHTFDPNPGTSNGFSGFELFLPSPIPEIADVTPNPGSVPPWEIDCCSGNPVEWDIRDSAGNGVMPGNTGVFSFTTDPRLVAVNDSGWFHTWEFDSQSDVTPTIGMHVPFVPGLVPPLCGNEVLDPGEECDPPGSITCPPGSPAGAFLPCNAECTCEQLGTTTTTTSTTTSTTTTTTLLDHFQCYEVKPKSFPTIPGVSVQDQFGSHTETVRFPHRLCAPADKRDEFPDAPTHPEHLIGHLVSGPSVKVPNQTLVNQFGTIKLDVVKPDILMVPTLKTLAPPGPPPLVQPTVDHFQCYKVKRSQGAPKFQKILGVKVDDQFGTAQLDLLKPARLCAPANKRNEDPTAPDHPFHLLCYKTKNSAFGMVQTFTNSQFGPAQPLLIHRRELCVPTLKNPVPTTTTTTQVSTTSTSTTTSSTQETTTTTSTTTTTTVYGSPSRAFLEPAADLLD
jgi:hypothetical protein